ncbi:MAG: metal ABC transporter substrate-binding protein [Acutalibacteraceae bacterium]|nr:metal ABC transporter substrate-binding protein [Acutalibacteraceae bacterium]
MCKRLISILTVLLLIALTFTGCTASEKTDNGNINIVSTIFPQYDFAREITGDKANLKMLIQPGGESHTYEPTPQDIISIQEADVFLYIGGENDKWVEDILKSIDTTKIQVVKLIDCVELTCVDTAEEHTHAHNEDNHAHEFDEHIWTSPMNAKKMVEVISNAICKADPENSEYYKNNTTAYSAQLIDLDTKIRDVVSTSKRNELVFGDRFPLVYFTNEYGLKHYSAFPGCSSETEPSASTIALLSDKVKQNNIPVILKIELSNSTVADTIASETSTRVLTFYSCHNLSKKQFEKGESYISMMTANLETLKTALN